MALFGRQPERRPGRVLVASGARVDLSDRKVAMRARKYRQGWQPEAWAYNDQIGELGFAHRFKGNACSRMRLFVAVQDPKDPKAPPVPIDDASGVSAKLGKAAVAALERLGVGRQAHATLLNSASVNFSVPGECHLLGRIDPEMGEVWEIRSIDEMIPADDGYHLRELPTDFTDGQVMNDKPLDADSSYVARLWTPHPRFKRLADSPMRPLLESCEELLLLSRGIRAAAKSRMAANGLLFVADEFTLTQAEESDDNALADPFMAAFTQAMTAPILDEAAPSAVVPIVIRGPAELAQSLVHIPLDRIVDKTALDTRAELIHRIATGLDLPAAILTGLETANHWCVDEQTEILTVDGWRTHDDLNAGDQVLTLNHGTGLSEWQMVQKVARFEVADEPMLSIENKFHSSLTTLNHRWPVLRALKNKTNRILGYERQWTRSSDLHLDDRIITAAPHADLPTEAKWADAFVALVGWFFTEGTCRWGDRNITPQVLIGQSHKANPENVARIRACLTDLYGPAHEGSMPKKGLPRTGDPTPRWRENPEERGMTLFSLNKAAAAPLLEVAPDRIVSLDFIRELTAEQLEIFMDAAAGGDGGFRRGGGRTVNQRNPDRLAAVELAAILAGHPTSTYTYMSGGFGEAKQWEISIGSRAPRASRTGLRVVSHTGIVWCPVTENTTWLARRDGKVFYTGNSAWAIDDNNFKHHIEPQVLTIVDALTAGYLWPALAAEGFKPEEYRTVSIWYDPTELVTHPDRTADALQLWDRYAISDEALRQAAGFADNDRPEDLEMARRLVSHTRTFPPNIVEAVIHALDPSLVIPADKSEPGYGPGGELEEPEDTAPADGKGQPELGPPPAPKQDGAPPAGKEGPAGPARASVRPLRALTAATAPPTPHRAGVQLADADRDLMVRLHTAADSEMRRALERAGARMRTKVRSSSAQATAIRDVANLAVCSTLGPDVVTAAGGDQDPSWADLREHWSEWIAAALAFSRGRARRLAEDLCQPGRAGAGRCAVSDRDLEALAIEQARHAEDGWRWLEGALTSLFRRLLYSPAPTPPPLPGQPGPLVGGTGALVPLRLVREAMALAGGGQADDVARGTAAGADVLDFLDRFGVAPSGYEWRHSSAGEPFEPHLDLDGLVVSGPDDPRLTNTDSFPDTDHLWPGDHGGCGCQLRACFGTGDILGQAA